MYNREYTPERISELKQNEIFVFGSNLVGAHGGGAARLAYNKFGAIWGEGVGLHGQSYAIPTMQGGVETIRPYVDDFIRFARTRPELKFYVTQIGCGIAGFKIREIAPLFQNALDVENVILPQSFVLELEGEDKYDLSRFVRIQASNYEQALKEVKDGLKRSHWIWYIFPQLKHLGHSWNSKFYGISGIEEAEAYLNHPVLGTRLREITNALLTHKDLSAIEIFGDIDAIKVRSCMTLFNAVSPNDIFEEVLAVFYDKIIDKRTINRINKNKK